MNHIAECTSADIVEEPTDVANFFTPDNKPFYDRYVYSSLDSDRLEIRVLQIDPGQQLDPISCTIINNFFLNEAHDQYDALSYCAGDAKNVEEILVDGLPFKIFANLGKALHALRHSNLHKLTWTDQICINQRNISERDQQVLLMRKVFASAITTYIWLGEPTKPGQRSTAISMVNTICDRLVEISLTSPTQAESALEVSTNIDRQSGREPVTKYDEHNPSVQDLEQYLQTTPNVGKWLINEIKAGNLLQELEAVREMFDTPWWARCWCLQEVIVAPSSVFLYGSASMTFVKLYLSLLTLDTAYQEAALAIKHDIQDEFQNQVDNEEALVTNVRVAATFGTLSRNLIVFALYEKWRKKSNLNLREVLNVSRAKESTDPRDRVYAMLGLVDPTYQVVPSYKSTNLAEDVFVQAAKAIIEHDGWLDVLCDSQEPDRDNGSTLPSWVPDYTQPLYTISLASWQYDDGWPKFDASGSRFMGDEKLARAFGAVPKPRFSPSKTGKVDCVLTFPVYSLGQLCNPSTLGAVGAASGEEEMSKLFENWISCREAASLGDVYQSTQESIGTAFSACLGFGATFDGTTAGGLEPKNQQGNEIMYFDILMEVTSSERWRYFVLPSGLMGFAPSTMEVGDFLVIPLWSRIPFVVRQLSSDSANGQKLIGPAYVHGYMQGQVVSEICEGKRKPGYELIELH